MAITDCGRATQSAVRATTISTRCLGVEARTIVSSAADLMMKECECVCGPRAGEEAGKRVATVSTLQKAGPALKTSRKPSRRIVRACNYFINLDAVNYPRHNTDRPIGEPASAREREGL